MNGCTVTRYPFFSLIAGLLLVTDSWMGISVHKFLRYKNVYLVPATAPTPSRWWTARARRCTASSTTSLTRGSRPSPGSRLTRWPRATPTTPSGSLTTILSRWYPQYQGPLQCHRRRELPHLDHVHPGHDLPAGGELAVQPIWLNKGKEQFNYKIKRNRKLNSYWLWSILTRQSDFTLFILNLK